VIGETRTRAKLAHLFMLGFAFFGAAGHPLARLAVVELHPLQLATASLVAGLACLIVLLVLTGRTGVLVRMSARDLGASAAIGSIGFFAFQIMTFSALARIPASVNAFLINTSVVYITILAAVALKERLSPGKIAGVIVALAGVPFVTFNQGFRVNGGVDLVGCLFSLLGAVSFATYSVLGKKLLVRNDPLVVTAIAVFAGTLMMGIMTALTVGYAGLLSVSPRAWVLAVIIGVTMNGLAYPLWFMSLRLLPASVISVYVYLTPLFAVALSYLILGERFGWLFWLGATLVLTGVVLADPPAGRRRVPSTG
jgi:drug/metabolite transporter (DMT)-like permease